LPSLLKPAFSLSFPVWALLLLHPDVHTLLPAAAQERGEGIAAFIRRGGRVPAPIHSLKN